MPTLSPEASLTAAGLLTEANQALQQGRHPEGAALAARAQAAALAQGQTDLAAQAGALHALLQVRLGDLEGAVASAQAALALAAALGPSATLSRVHSTLSLAYERSGLQALAVAHAANALDLALQLDDRHAECWALIRLGCTDDPSGQRRDLGLLQQAVALARQLADADPSALFAALNNLARRWTLEADRHASDSAARQESLRQALAAAQQAQAQAQQGPGNPNMAATAGANLAGIQQRLGQTGQARATRKQALATAQAGSLAGLAHTLAMAQAHQDLREAPSPDTEAALARLLEDAGATQADPDLRLQARRTLVDACTARGDAPAALRHLETLHRDSLTQAQQRAQLQARLSFNHAELQHARLSAERAAQAASQAHQRAETAARAAQQLAEEHRQLSQAVAEGSEALARAQATAEAASQAKRTFLGIVSHELRTPLHGVVGLLDLAQRRAHDTPLAQHLDRAQQAARQLAQLIDSMLRYVAADSPPTQPAAWVDLRALLARLQQAAAQGGHAVDLTVAPEVPALLRLDSERLCQILAVLLDNAAKFSPAQPAQLVARWQPAAQHPAQLHITLTDSGPGVPDALRPRLFQPFELGDSSFSRRHGGLGLGLALAQRLAHSLGGELGLAPAVGPGSQFWLRLPAPAGGPDWTAPPASTGG